MPAGLVVVLATWPVILAVRVISAPLTDAPLGPVMVPETLPVEDSWAEASDENHEKNRDRSGPQN